MQVSKIYTATRFRWYCGFNSQSYFFYLFEIAGQARNDVDGEKNIYLSSNVKFS